MPTMDLARSNEEFAVAAAELIDRNGLAWAQYYDDRTGCYCTLGAFRMLVFGSADTSAAEQQAIRVPRYLELVDWFAAKLRTLPMFENRERLTGESVVGMWNDGCNKVAVVGKLREVGSPG